MDGALKVCDVARNGVERKDTKQINEVRRVEKMFVTSWEFGYVMVCCWQAWAWKASTTTKNHIFKHTAYNNRNILMAIYYRT